MIRTRTWPIAAVFAALALTPARAEVVEVSETGFAVKAAVTVPVPPEKAFTAFLAIGKWWDSAHTYSGDSSNLSIDPKPQGCFCERLPDGGVVHMTVAFVSPGKRLVLRGALGPLQTMGVDGGMTITFAPAGDKGTTVTLHYVVGGHNAGGFQEISAGVEGVLRSQLERYRAYADPAKP